MAKSKKAKKEKAQDFQKPKLKVGKAKPKSANFTDTSFQSRCKIFGKQARQLTECSLFLAISVPQQSLATAPKTLASLFAHHLSLCASKSVSQRTESLAHLTALIERGRPPQPLSAFLPRVAPLLHDASLAVRSNTLKLFCALPQQDVEQCAATILLYVRAGMVSLAAGVQLSSLDAMEWLLENAALQVVSTWDGWVGTLETFEAVLRWNFDRTQDAANVAAKALRVLAIFLARGLTQTCDFASVEAEDARRGFPYTNFPQMMVSRSVCLMAEFMEGFGSLDVSSRRTIFEKSMPKFKENLQRAKNEGGSVGREAAGCMKALESFFF